MILYRLFTPLFLFFIASLLLLSRAQASGDVAYIDFSAVNSVAYGGQDNTGTVRVENSGLSLRLIGNRVRAIPFNYQVTPNTRLSFEFSSPVKGEVQAIGFDTDLYLSQSQTIQLYGTQIYGRQTYHNYSGTGLKGYDIAIGDFFRGDIRYLFFVMDHDVQDPDGESVFSHVRVYEKGQLLEEEKFSPVVSFFYPVIDSALEAGSNMHVEINANDVDGNISYCNLYLNGTLLRKDAVPPYAWGVNPRSIHPLLMNIQPGTYQLKAECVDNDNLSGSVMQNIVVNSLPDSEEFPPVVSFFYPVIDSALEAGSNMHVEINANDVDGNISYCNLYLNGTLLRKDAVFPYAWGVNPRSIHPLLMNIQPGTYQLKAECVDNDNLSGSVMQNIVVNSLPDSEEFPPVVSFFYPVIDSALEAGSNMHVEINANDVDGNISYCNLYLNGTLLRKDAVFPYAWGVNPRSIHPLLMNIQPGTYQLKAECTDNDNLSGSVEQSVVVVSSSEPRVSDVILDWVVPSTREDGTTLLISEIEGYVIYYYRDNSSDSGYNLTIPLRGNGGELTTSYLVPALPSGRYYFSIASVDIDGRVSQFSEAVELTIQ